MRLRHRSRLERNGSIGLWSINGCDYYRFLNVFNSYFEPDRFNVVIHFYPLNGTCLTSVHVDAYASTGPVDSISAKFKEAEPIDVVKAVRFSMDTPCLLHANKKWIKFSCHFWEFLNLVKKASSVQRKKRVLWWMGGNLGGRGACWVCARSSHRRHRAGLGLLGIGIFFAGFSVPEDPGSSVRTSGPKLTVAYNFKWPLVDR